MQITYVLLYDEHQNHRPNSRWQKKSGIKICQVLKGSFVLFPYGDDSGMINIKIFIFLYSTGQFQSNLVISIFDGRGFKCVQFKDHALFPVERSSNIVKFIDNFPFSSTGAPDLR